MLDRFKEYIRINNLVKKNDEVLLAISGGIDSIVMLDLFDKSGIKFAISHCNFKLRMFESDDDEMFVRQLAHKYSVEVYVNWCNTKEYAKENKLSIQEAARNLRYAWFKQVSNHNNYSNIAIAHQQDDNIETFFINLLRGAGLKGLKGIPIKRQNIIRPMMFTSRKEIEEYAKEHMLDYREDSSNSTDDYLRNNIRHNIIPKIEDISKGFANSIKKSIDNLSDSELILNSVIKEKTEQLFTDNNNGTKTVLISDLMKLEPYRIWMYYILNEFGFIRQVTDSICMALVEGNFTGLRFNSSDFELLIDRDKILLREVIKKTTAPTYKIPVNKNYITRPLKINFEHCKKISTFDFSDNKSIAYFDLDKLVFPLTMRKWQPGDRMIPFGMNGTKLISDILINDKVDSFEKENIYVILSQDKIIWLVGYRSSNVFRISKSTTNIITMELLSNNSGFELELFK